MKRRDDFNGLRAIFQLIAYTLESIGRWFAKPFKRKSKRRRRGEAKLRKAVRPIAEARAKNDLRLLNKSKGRVYFDKETGEAKPMPDFTDENGRALPDLFWWKNEPKKRSKCNGRPKSILRHISRGSILNSYESGMMRFYRRISNYNFLPL